MSRKYRHQGYQQDDSREESRPAGHAPSAPQNHLTPEELIQRRSLRRATERQANEVMRCHNCGRNVQSVGAIVADSRCPQCAAHLHCCRTCLHFDTAARWQCRAPIPAAITAKNDANTCVEYQSRLVLDATGRRSPTGPQGSSNSNDPKSQFENLFKR